MGLIDKDRAYGVDIYTNDDSEDYEFRINGAVCAKQAYDGIRDPKEVPGIFYERCAHARYVYETRQGPIYCY